MTFLDDERELIKDVGVTIENDELKLAPLMEAIKKLGKPIDHMSISYFSETDKMDVFVGIDPIGDDKKVNIHELGGHIPIKIMLKIKEPSRKSAQSSF